MLEFANILPAFPLVVAFGCLAAPGVLQNFLHSVLVAIPAGFVYGSISHAGGHRTVTTTNRAKRQAFPRKKRLFRKERAHAEGSICPAASVGSPQAPKFFCNENMRDQRSTTSCVAG